MEWFNCSKAERQGRCKLACLYRLLDLYGHTHFPNTYITVSTCIHYTLFFNLSTQMVFQIWFRTDCAPCHFACNKIGCFCLDNIGCHSDGLSVRTMQREKRIVAIVEKIDTFFFFCLYSIMTCHRDAIVIEQPKNQMDYCALHNHAYVPSQSPQFHSEHRHMWVEMSELRQL